MAESYVDLVSSSIYHDLGAAELDNDYRRLTMRHGDAVVRSFYGKESPQGAASSTLGMWFPMPAPRRFVGIHLIR